MKIALIAPPYPLAEAPSPPLGLSYVAAACEQAGASVLFLDYIVEKYSFEKMARQLEAFQPDVVGTTAVTMNFNTAIKMIRDAKKALPSCTTMMGGPHVSFAIQNTLESYPHLDLIVYGEGEATLLELVPLLKTPEAWESIAGIAFRKNGQVQITQERPLIKDLDPLPFPARHLLPLSRYQALGFPVTIITSRGCPNQCIFCLGRRMVGQKPRFRSAAAVADEIEQLVAWGMTRINIADDLFTASKKRVRQLCEEILRRGIQIEWSVFARVNTVDPETLSIMRQAGCDTISFGIESGNQEMLKRVKKGITLAQVKRAVSWSKAAGMRTHASFMVGLPGETLETMQASRALATALDIDWGFHFLSPFPGTVVREQIPEYDLEILTDNWDLYDANQAIVRTSGLSPEQMDDFVAETYAVFDEKAADMEKRYHEGTYSEEDFLLTEGKYRMHLIYQLLLEDMITEERSFTAGAEAPEASLISWVADETGMDAAMVGRTMKSLIDAGYIASGKSEKGITWYWTHNNQVKKMKNSCPAPVPS